MGVLVIRALLFGVCIVMRVPDLRNSHRDKNLIKRPLALYRALNRGSLRRIQVFGAKVVPSAGPPRSERLPLVKANAALCG